jgi:hypothetical protein
VDFIDTPRPAMMFVASHRSVFGRRVVLGDHHHRPGQHQADDRAAVDAAGAIGGVRHHRLGDRPEGDRGKQGGDEHTCVQRVHDLAATGLHEERTDHRRDDRSTAQHQRKDHTRRAGFGCHHPAKQHGGDQGDRIGLEQVGGHAGAIADVVAHVVRDDRRIARVIFRDTGLDLAHEIRTDIRTLGEDAAAQTGEDRDERGAEGQADQRMQGMRALVAHVQQHAVVPGNAEQGEPDHQHAGDRTPTESHGEGRRKAASGGLCGTNVGTNRNVHADVAGGPGEDRPHREPDARSPVEEDTDKKQEDDADSADGGVLAVEVCACAFLDGRGDLLHSFVARRPGKHPADRKRAVQNRNERTCQRDP